MQTVDTTKKKNFLELIKEFVQNLPPLTWVMIAMVIFFGIAAPGFFNLNNFTNVMRRGSSLWILATMATLVLISGGLDLSLGSVLTFSGVVLALLLKADIKAGPAILAAILCGTFVGIINGLLVSVLGIPAFIVTLGSMNVFAGLSIALTDTGAVFIGDPTMVFIGAGAIAGIPVPILIAVIIFALSYVILHHTSFGRYLVAIGENKMGAHLSGVNTQRYTWLIFAYVSTMAAIAGVVLASRIQSADPTVGVGWEFDAVAASIMGGTLRGKGKGDITTTIVGVLVIIILRNGLNIIGVPIEWRTAVVGLFLMAGIIFDITVRRREN